MAKIIEFAPRSSVGKPVKRVRAKKRGMVIEFPKKLKTSA